MCRKMKLDHLLTSHTKINSKCIKDLNVRPETIKILEENIGSKILDSACSNILSDISPQARETKEKINKWATSKFWHNKENHQQNKKTPHRMGEYICHTSYKGLISKIYKVLTKLNTKKTNNTVKKWVKDLNRYFS